MAHPSWNGPCKGTIKTVVLSNGVKLPVRQEIAELVGLLCEQTMKRGYRLVPGWCWGYACRKIRGSNSWSNHAWGLAVDLNAPKNPMSSRLITDMPDWMPVMWKSYGFRWGGDYRGRKDAMHYEFTGSVQDAKAYTERARRQLVKSDTKGKGVHMFIFGVKSSDAAKAGVWLATESGKALHIPKPEDIDGLKKAGVSDAGEMSQSFLERFERIHPANKNLP